MGSSDQVRCRARVSKHCEHGHVMPEEFDPWREDGTYEKDTDTVICDPCYLVVCKVTPSGRGLHHELPAALDRIREAA